MSIVERIQEDLKRALKEHNQITVSTLRLLLAGVKNEAIAKRAELPDEEVVRVIQREAKHRTEAIETYTAGASPDRAAQEAAELQVLQRYLPEQLDDAAIDQAVQAAIVANGASGPQDFGRVMKVVVGELQGKADGKRIQAAVKRLLASPDS